MGYPFRFVSLWEMLELNGSEFLHAYQMVSTLIQTAGVSLKAGQGLIITPASRQEFADSLEFLEKHCSDLEMPLSTKAAGKMREAFRSGVARPNGVAFSGDKLHSLHRHLDDFSRKVRDEYTTRVFLAVPYGRAKYYSDPKNFFGVKAWEAFPTNGQFEMEEACRCFALARSTAAVFHLMRLLETAIAALRKSLGIPDPVKASKRNWGEILKLIKEELDKRNAKGGPGWADQLDRSLFGEFYLLLSAVKDTWRNPTMHVENKYTEEEAENILTTVRAFVRKVASRMDEEGEPKA